MKAVVVLIVAFIVLFNYVSLETKQQHTLDWWEDWWNICWSSTTTSITFIGPKVTVSSAGATVNIICVVSGCIRRILFYVSFIRIKWNYAIPHSVRMKFHESSRIVMCNTPYKNRRTNKKKPLGKRISESEHFNVCLLLRDLHSNGSDFCVFSLLCHYVHSF